jgi:hypothetical protein
MRNAPVAGPVARIFLRMRPIMGHFCAMSSICCLIKGSCVCSARFSHSSALARYSSALDVRSAPRLFATDERYGQRVVSANSVTERDKCGHCGSALFLNARRIFASLGHWIVRRQRHFGGRVVPRHTAFATPLRVLMFHPLICLLPRLFLLVS